jgi:two-component system, OmpR family, response regulator
MTILLVDDARDTRTVARLALQQLGGFTVVEAGSGPEALEAAARVQPDLIILDVMMPGMDGPEVLAALRAAPATGAIPVMFLTAKAMPDEVARLRALGVVDLQVKPFAPIAFVGAVRAALLAATDGASAPRPWGAPADAPTTATAIDPNALRLLEGLTTETGADLPAALIALFESNTPGDVEQMAHLASRGAGSAGELERLAHTLKSSAGTIGATGIASLAREVETLAREARLHEAVPPLDEIRQAVGPTVASLRAERGRHRNPQAP